MVNISLMRISLLFNLLRILLLDNIWCICRNLIINIGVTIRWEGLTWGCSDRIIIYWTALGLTVNAWYGFTIHRICLINYISIILSNPLSYLSSNGINFYYSSSHIKRSNSAVTRFATIRHIHALIWCGEIVASICATGY